jgi:hypothetical protein
MILGANGRPLVRRLGFALPGDEYREDDEGETTALVSAVGDWRQADVTDFEDAECGKERT